MECAGDVAKAVAVMYNITLSVCWDKMFPACSVLYLWDMSLAVLLGSFFNPKCTSLCAKSDAFQFFST